MILYVKEGKLPALQGRRVKNNLTLGNCGNEYLI